MHTSTTVIHESNLATIADSVATDDLTIIGCAAHVLERLPQGAALPTHRLALALKARYGGVLPPSRDLARALLRLSASAILDPLRVRVAADGPARVWSYRHAWPIPHTDRSLLQ